MGGALELFVFADSQFLTMYWLRYLSKITDCQILGLVNAHHSDVAASA
jgi:hypothetical protein